MSTRIGCGWTKSTKDGATYMSFSLNEEITQLFPQLKGMNLTAFHIPQTERKNENSPGWSLVISSPQYQKNASDDEEIPI